MLRIQEGIPADYMIKLGCLFETVLRRPAMTIQGHDEPEVKHDDSQISNKKSKNRLIENLKRFTFKVIGFNDNLAKVTVGGVDLKYINPKTMESTITPDLYFAGEVLDAHGPTGGYNLKIAFSTGYLAGLSASEK